jgi:hypothetical protein
VTSTTIEPRIESLGPIPPRRYGIAGLLASEWTKLKSVRSTVWTLLVMAFVGIGLGAVVTSAQASRWSTRTFAEMRLFDPTRSSLSGLLFAQLAIGVLAVLVVSAEYSSGTIRATFSAAPRRPLVLVAKVIVFSAVVLVVGEAVSFCAFFLGQHLLAGGHAPTASLSDPDVRRAVLSGGLYLFALGLLALGLATIIRHTAASISAFVGLLLILPIISAALPTQLDDDISRFLPAAIGTVMLSGHYHGTDSFGPWTGFALLGGYAIASLVAGGILLVRRDV